MVKAQSLVNYKIGYDHDSTKKTKSIEVEENGATITFAVTVVSGEKDVEYQINEQPNFFELSNMLPRLYWPQKFWSIPFWRLQISLGE